MVTEGACQLEKKSIKIKTLKLTYRSVDSIPSQYDDTKMLNQQEMNNRVVDFEKVDDNVKQEEDMVDCEPSMDVNDESIHNANKIDFDSSSKHEIESMSCGGTPAKLKSKSPQKSGTPIKPTDDVKNTNQEEQQVEQSKDDEKDHDYKENENSIEINGPIEAHHQIINKGIAVSKQIGK